MRGIYKKCRTLTDLPYGKHHAKSRANDKRIRSKATRRALKTLN